MSSGCGSGWKAEAGRRGGAGCRCMSPQHSARPSARSGSRRSARRRVQPRRPPLLLVGPHLAHQRLVLGVGGADERVVANLQLRTQPQSSSSVQQPAQRPELAGRHQREKKPGQGESRTSTPAGTTCHPPTMALLPPPGSRPSTAACTRPPPRRSAPWAPARAWLPPAQSSRHARRCPSQTRRGGRAGAGSAQSRRQRWWGTRCPCAALRAGAVRGSSTGARWKGVKRKGKAGAGGSGGGGAGAPALT